MLVRLTPEQVAEYWEGIKFAVEESLPPVAVEKPGTLNRILEAMLVGIIQAWVSLRREDKKVVALVTTTVADDNISRTKSLLIYSTYAFEQSEKSDWIEGFAALSKFAKGMKCDNITAYSNEADILKIAQYYNPEMTTYIRFPLR